LRVTPVAKSEGRLKERAALPIREMMPPSGYREERHAQGYARGTRLQLDRGLVPIVRGLVCADRQQTGETRRMRPIASRRRGLWE
jgi:hypothetical protein